MRFRQTTQQLLPLLAAAWLMLGGWRAAAAPRGEISARVIVPERSHFYLGEAIPVEIHVNGSEDVMSPDLAGLADFTAEYLGGNRNSRTSITIINGRQTQDIFRGFVLSYRLTPKRVGRLALPALEIQASGRTVRTEPLEFEVRQPQETDDLKLRMRLPKSDCYVGEVLPLAVTWYVGQEVRNFEFTLPFLDTPGCLWLAPPLPADIQRRDARERYLTFEYRNENIIAERGRESLGGRDYTTITFRRLLVPQSPGRIELPGAAVVCETMRGFRERRPHPLLPMRQSGYYERTVVPAKPLTLEVKPLPAAGRPANFAGHIGRFAIEADAEPLEVNVGDPITLTVTLTSPDFIEHVELPPLQDQAALARDFRIPAERAPGKTVGARRVFTQTIRATHEQVKEIPALELPYFDPETGRYEIARSQPLSLTVRDTRIVTHADAEGRAETGQSASGGRELQRWTAGIAHNYDGLEVLRTQNFGPGYWLQSGVWRFALAAPPACWLLLWALLRLRHRDPAAWRGRQARRAAGGLRSRLAQLRRGPAESATPAAMLEALRAYFGVRLELAAGALTADDIAAALAARQVDEATASELRRLVADCEAELYGGRSWSKDDFAAASDRALKLVGTLEGQLR